MNEDIIIVLSICVLLPVALVWVTSFYSNKKLNRKAALIEKAIERGADLDVMRLVESTAKDSRRSVKKWLMNKLQVGMICAILGIASTVAGISAMSGTHGIIPVVAIGVFCLAVGAGFIVAYGVGLKMFAEDIRAEDEALKNCR